MSERDKDLPTAEDVRGILGPPPMTSPELLPCPFCGASEAFVTTLEHHSSKNTYYRVKCDNCEAMSFGCFCLTRQDAIEEWNTRAPSTVGVEATCTECFLEQAHRDADWIGLSASEKAAYDWPEDTDLHRQCRAAYVAGATDYASPTLASEKEGGKAIVGEVERACAAYLAEAPLDGRHSDAAGGNAYEIIAWAQEELAYFRAQLDAAEETIVEKRQEIERLRAPASLIAKGEEK